MKIVFVDTAYWAAIANPRDRLHGVASRSLAELDLVRLVTTDAVLAEFLTLLSRPPRALREPAARTVREAFNEPAVEVIQQCRSLFLKTLEMYEARPDKSYSFTDCMSMVVMKQRAIWEILTSDHHFEQEGFTILM